jgi:uncharacterized protein YutE (UPF0331/DUF86 family)
VVDRRKLSSRLQLLESYLTELRSLRNVSREEFLREGRIHHLAERFLHLASECVLDIAQHIIADEGYVQAPTNKATMDVLQEEGVLEPELAKRMRRWMGFRNVLVHLYADIDHGKSYDVIQNDLADLEEFAAAVSRFL